MKITPVITGTAIGYLLATAIQIVYSINFIQQTTNHPFFTQATLYVILAGLLLYLYYTNAKTDKKELLKWVSTGFLLFLVLTSVTIIQTTRDNPQYTSWAFHECYTQSLNAKECTLTTIQNQPGMEDMGYAYYPPVTHLIGKLIPLQALMVLTLIALWLVTWIGSRNPLTPIAVFYSTFSIWTSFVRGGTLPFFLALIFLLILALYWRKLPWIARLLVIGLALFTHIYMGWLAVVLGGLLFACEIAKTKSKLPVFILMITTASYYLVYIELSARILLLPIAFMAILLNNDT